MCMHAKGPKQTRNILDPLKLSARPLALLEEGLKSKGVSVRVAHAEAEQQEAGEHARHRPDGEHAQVVHADARHVERAEGARAVPRQPVARLVGVAELVEDVVPKRGDRGVLRV